jgi:hypothetical protein
MDGEVWSCHSIRPRKVSQDLTTPNQSPRIYLALNLSSGPVLLLLNMSQIWNSSGFWRP